MKINNFVTKLQKWYNKKRRIQDERKVSDKEMLN